MRRNRVRFIYWAFMLSLFMHVSLAPLASHIKMVDASKEKTEIFILEKRARPTPPPTPRPTPKPKVQPRQPIKQNPIAIHPPQPATNANSGKKTAPNNHPATVPPGDGRSGGDGNDARATGAPDPTVAPSATPKPVCSTPFADAQTVNEYSPEMPQIARDQGLTGTAQVKVDLSAGGTVLDVKIFRSAGSTALDNAALDAAKRTTYTPKVVDCEPVPGTYLFRVEFSDN